MPYCSYCGVEVDKDTVTCPLCGAEIPAASNEPPLFTGDYPKRENRLRYSRRPFSPHERRVVLSLFSLILTVPFSIVLVVDFYTGAGFGWSIYPIVALGGVWIAVAIALFLRGFWKLFLSYFLLAMILGLIFNALAGSQSAFLRWNMPILLMATLLTLGCAFYARRVQRIGANLAAVILWAICLFSLGIDALVHLHTGAGGGPISWSIIVASALVPTGLLLMFIHYRFARSFSIKRYFNA